MRREAASPSSPCKRGGIHAPSCSLKRPRVALLLLLLPWIRLLIVPRVGLLLLLVLLLPRVGLLIVPREWLLPWERWGMEARGG